MSDTYFKELSFTVRILKDSHTLVSRSYRQLHSSLGSEVKPDNWGACAHTLGRGGTQKQRTELNCSVPKIWSRSKCFGTHPQSVIIDYYQSKFMALVNLVFSSHKHLDHLLANVEGICFRPKCIEKNYDKRIIYCHRVIKVYFGIGYPLKDSNFGKDISSERSKQMICNEEDGTRWEQFYIKSKSSFLVQTLLRTVMWAYHFLWTVDTRNSKLVLCRRRHRGSHSGLQLWGFWSVFRRSSSRQWHCGTGCSHCCYYCGRGHRLSCCCRDRCSGGTQRTVTGWSFAFSLNTTSYSWLWYVGITVST